MKITMIAYKYKLYNVCVHLFRCIQDVYEYLYYFQGYRWKRKGRHISFFSALPFISFIYIDTVFFAFGLRKEVEFFLDRKKNRSKKYNMEYTTVTSNLCKIAIISSFLPWNPWLEIFMRKYFHINMSYLNVPCIQFFLLLFHCYLEMWWEKDDRRKRKKKADKKTDIHIIPIQIMHATRKKNTMMSFGCLVV